MMAKRFSAFSSQTANFLGNQTISLSGDEVKYHDKLVMNSVAISTAVQVFDLTDVAQGPGSDQRIGRKIKVRGVEVQGNIFRADDNNNVRIMLFKWHVNSTSAPVWNPDIISRGISTGISAPVDLYAPYQLAYNPSSFTMLHDHIINLTADRDQCSFRIAQPLNYSCTFNAALLTGLHHLYLFVISDSGAVTHPVGDMISRVYYTDV
jgi:hypothetical protein